MSAKDQSASDGCLMAWVTLCTYVLQDLKIYEFFKWILALKA